MEVLERLEQICPLPEELEGFQAYIKQQQEQQQQQQQQGHDSEGAAGAAGAAAAAAGEGEGGLPPLRDVEAAMLPLVRLTVLASRIRIVRFEFVAPKTLRELEEALDLVDRAAEQVRSIKR